MSVTVAELIAELQQYPPTDLIDIEDNYGDYANLIVSPPPQDLQRSGETLVRGGDINPEEYR